MHLRAIFLLAWLVFLGHGPDAVAVGDAKPRPWKASARDVPIAMRDGRSLMADVYRPDTSERYPTILIQTPYDKTRFGAVTRGEIGRGSRRASDRFDREHYAYVVVDWRGFFASKKAMDGVSRRTFRRGHDGYDCVEWIARQPWSNGRVGTWGGSALGKQQFDTAAEKPPHLVCCVPLIAAMGQRYDFYYDGGILREGHVKTLDALGYGVSKRVRAAPLASQPIWGIAKRRTYRPQLIDVPCLLVTGWWDHFPDQVIETFDDIVAHGGPAARKHSRLIIGPWDHISIDVEKQGDLMFSSAADYSTTATLRFFDHFLRELSQSWEDVPRLQYWQCQSDEPKWRGSTGWNGITRKATTLHLHASGLIARLPKPDGKDSKKKEPAKLGKDVTAKKDARSYHYDPQRPSKTLGGANLPPMRHGPTRQNSLRDRTDVLTYATAALGHPLAVNGSVELTFSFSLDRVDADFTARLCDRDSAGRSILVADAAGRSRFRNGSHRKEMLEPGQRAEITLRFPVIAYTFREGHKLELLLSSGNHPRYERNNHDGADHWSADRALDLHVTIHHELPAVLTLPLLPLTD